MAARADRALAVIKLQDLAENLTALKRSPFRTVAQVDDALGIAIDGLRWTIPHIRYLAQLVDQLEEDAESEGEEWKLD